MKLVSFAINVVFHWLTNNSVQKPKRFIAAIVMTHNLHRDAMAVAPYFVRVRMLQFNLHNFIVLGAHLSIFHWLIYWYFQYMCVYVSVLVM